MGYTERSLIETVGALIKRARSNLGWTQDELGRRAQLSRGMIARIENRGVNMTVATLGTLVDQLGVHIRIEADGPVLTEPRRRDPVHARAVAYQRLRLEQAGWQVATEVDIGGRQGRGWIDLMAFEARSRTLLVDETKTELSDVGGADRQLTRYERDAWYAARRLGWRPARVVAVLALVATQANEEALRSNRDYLGGSFSARASHVRALLANPTMEWPRYRRALFMIDPLSRRHDWVGPTRLEGRRSAPPYGGYVDVLRAMDRRSRAHRRTRRLPPATIGGEPRN